MYTKLSRDLPIDDFRRGASFAPLVIYVWMVTQMTPTDAGGVVTVDADYRAIKDGTSYRKTESIVAALRHLTAIGAVQYLGQTGGARRYEVTNRYAVYGPGLPRTAGKPLVTGYDDDSISSISDQQSSSSTQTFGCTEGQDARAREGRVFAVYEAEIGRLTAMAADNVGDLIDAHGPAAVIEAIHAAVEYNARNIRYVEAVLENRAKEADLPDSDRRRYISGEYADDIEY